jgi:hypothetical protein
MRRLYYLLIIVALHGCAHVDEQWFYVSGASLQEFDRHRQLSQAFATKTLPRLSYDDREFVVTGHRIRDGEGVVLAFRSFAPGRFLVVDQASFLKITSFLPRTRLDPGMEIQLPDSNGTVVFLSTSSSNMPGGTGCFGYASHGSIKVHDVSAAQINVTVDLHFRLSSPLGFSDECNERNVRGAYVLSRLRLQELTPWQGATGNTLHDETIAR